MLERKFRLNARTSFTNARVITSPLLTIKYITTTLPYTRVGFVTSKAVSKRAVVRNRSKRVVRSCIEQLLPSLLPGYDMLVIIKQRTGQKKVQELWQAIEQLLKKNHLLTPSA